MGNRLSKIYTRTGDQGSSALADGGRIDKDDARLHAIGSVDEANSAIGLAIAELKPQELIDLLLSIQHDLFNIGGELSMPGHSFIGDEKITALENAIDQFNQELPPLKEFILPGGSRAASACHLARAIVRRAERDVVHLSKTSNVEAKTLIYLNRLSDFLFVCARMVNKELSVDDVLWEKKLGST